MTRTLIFSLEIVIAFVNGATEGSKRMLRSRSDWQVRDE